MKINFQDTSENGFILTSQNPEGFIIFEIEAGDPSSYLLPYCGSTYGLNSSEKLFINGIDGYGLDEFDVSSYDISIGLILNSTSISPSGPDPSIAAFHIFSNSKDDFTCKFRIVDAYRAFTSDGSNRINSWTNAGGTFDTFDTSDGDIISAIDDGATIAWGYTNSFGSFYGDSSVKVGSKYHFSGTLTQNSGTMPERIITGS